MRADDGFTLIELLVTMAVAVIVFGATLSVLDVFQRNNRFELLRNETGDTARTAIDRLARELRNVAAPSTKEAGALELAEEYSVTFETIDSTGTSENPSGVMRVRYCLNNSTPTNEVLWKQVDRWSGATPAVPTATACPDLNAGDWDSSTQVIQHVTNRIKGKKRPLFTYGPEGATLVSQITTVKPMLYIDLNPGARPGESQLSSAIDLRNQNRPPKASFTVVQLGAHRVLLNASESSDPDGLALTYKWWDGTTQLSTTSEQVETEKLVAGSNHTFKLEVTDPGGLKSTAEQAVTII
ncbi:MAG TPA: prepilin-type N-terminal cleavage/methylation domain-containing protein [Solirubrobacteraceae bacterium]|nr:prepilin-type N-terminal cleavage/methylation domain-containing protein [Solirubrobacteraceae bacterium]